MGHKYNQISKITSRSSGILWIGTDINTPADLITNPLLTDNGNGTFNINHAGQAEIIDRSNPSYPKQKYPSWSIANNIAIGTDGVYVILIDSTGTIVQHQYSDQSSELKATDENFNTDNHIQLGTLSVDGGFISSIQPVIQYSGNISNRFRAFQRLLGLVNSSKAPISITPILNTLNLQINVGNSASADFGYVKLGSKAPDIDRVDPVVAPAFLLTALRDNSIIGAGFDLDVSLFESSIGIATVMTNNRASNRWLISFTDFAGVILGQTEHNSVAIALASTNLANIPAIASAGLLVTKIAVLKNTLNLDFPNAEFKSLPRIDL